MKPVFVLALLVAVVLTEVSSLRRSRSPETQKKDCKEGDSYFSGCNHCICHDNGPPTCTLKACPENLGGNLPSHPSLQIDPTRPPQ